MRARPRLDFRVARDAWSLWWPCESCGGSELPLLARFDSGELLEALASGADQVRRQPCPGCRSRRNRAADGLNEPELWYDVDLTDWVLRVPFAEYATAVIFPLGIRWYDVPQALVHCAAAALTRAGHALIANDARDEA